MAGIEDRDLFQEARKALKGEDDAVFMFGATKPDGQAMKTLSSQEAEEVRQIQDKLLGDTENHSKFLGEMIKHAVEMEGGRPLAPDRMQFIPQFEGLFKIETEMLITHIRLYQKYLKTRGFDKWARGLQSILREEFEHVKMTQRLLSLAVLSDPEK